MPYPFSEPVRQALMLVLPAVGVVLALLQPPAARRPALRRATDVALGLLVLLGFGLYSNGNWAAGRYFNAYEFFHYYVGAKYAPELGYTRLYDAATVLDRETGHPRTVGRITNLAEGAGTREPEYKRLGQVYREEDEIRAAFTPERWAEFRADVIFFRDDLGPMWERLQLDKGYNPPPPWTLVGRALAEAVPTSRPAAVHALAWLDPLLLLIGFAFLGWAFGARTGLFAAALYLTHYCTSHAHFRAAFLRTDWLAALMVSVSLLRRGSPAGAGALAAWAALVRVFPLLFAFWAPARIVTDLVARRRPDRAAVRFLTAFAATGAVVVALTLVVGGLEPWRGFLVKIGEHDTRPASDTVGFRNLFLWTIAFDASQGSEIRALFERREVLWWLCQGVFAVLLALVLRRRPSHEALALSFVMVWCLVAPAYYYYALLVVPLTWCAARCERWDRAVGLALLFATGLVGRAFHPGRELTLQHSFLLALSFGLVAVTLCVMVVLEERRAAGVIGETGSPGSPAS
jgi:hypothetical protein